MAPKTPGPEIRRVIRGGDRDVDVIEASEVARILGVSRQQVYELGKAKDKRPPFPAPVTGPDQTALWRRDEIEGWGDLHPEVGGRRSGVQPYEVEAEMSFQQRWSPPTLGKQRFEQSINELPGRNVKEPEVEWLEASRVRLVIGLEAPSIESAKETTKRVLEGHAHSAGIGVWPFHVSVLRVARIE